MLGLVLLASAILICAVLALMVWKGMPSGSFTRDPSTVLDGQLYIGFLSQIGIFFWAASASVCLFSAWLCSFGTSSVEAGKFFFYSGLLFLLLGLDDVFLLHEHFFPFLGVPEHVVYFGYEALVLLYLLRFHRFILGSEFVLLGLSLSCFALSVLVDWLEPEWLDIFLVEDGTKLIGIVGWMAYFFLTCYRYILDRGVLRVAAQVVPGPAAQDVAFAKSKESAPTLP